VKTFFKKLTLPFSAGSLGGLWGFFSFAFFPRILFLPGLLFSLDPTLVRLFIIFPIQAGKGLMGFDLGNLSPLFVLFFNAVWGSCHSDLVEFYSRRKNRYS
jgi:hypothetical protein